MNNLWMTVGSYNWRTQVPLDEVAWLFGVSPAIARRKAAHGELPVATYRLDPHNQKAPLMVSVVDLHNWQEKCAESARERMVA